MIMNKGFQFQSYNYIFSQLLIIPDKPKTMQLVLEPFMAIVFTWGVFNKPLVLNSGYATTFHNILFIPFFLRYFVSTNLLALKHSYKFC